MHYNHCRTLVIEATNILALVYTSENTSISCKIVSEIPVKSESQELEVTKTGNQVLDFTITQ